ncbi:MAG: hypothetical protein HQK51_11285 [Oligoflexia bacterium]|nr:hypothetical protein [Oligoflexia bacterium]
MVVVAIIGILSAVAVPNFQKYQAKSRTSEAKIQLAGLYTAEIAFYSDYSVYAACLSNMGYNPSPEKSSRYYAIGFTSAGLDSASTKAIDNGAAACDEGPLDGKNYFLAKKTASGPSAKEDLATNAVSPGGFTAGAGGRIMGSAVDKWSITQSKILNHDSPGY